MSTSRTLSKHRSQRETTIRCLQSILFAALIFSISVNAIAAEQYIGDGKVTAEAPTFWGMTIDLLVLRPLGFGATVLGSALFLVALPITLPTDSVQIASDKFVREPASFTFERPLGTSWEDSDDPR